MKRLAIFVGLALLALGPLGVSSAANPRLAGSLDPSFGDGGAVTANGLVIRAIAVQPDGKIVAAGSSADGLALVRYLPNGSLDPSFGDGGYVDSPLPHGGFADAVALQPDGRIVVAGASNQNGEVLEEFTLARYNSNGSLDTSFGTDGIANTVIPEPADTFPRAEADALAILPDGRIVAAGTSDWSESGASDDSTSFVLARYKTDGSLDPTFGNAGIVQTSFEGQGYLRGIAVQPDGKIVATGSAGYGGHGGVDLATMALARYESDGSLDPTFGTSGRVTTSSERYYDGGPVVLQRGRILVAGTTSKNGNTKPWFPVLSRYQASGRVDPSFGQHGVVEIKRQLGAPSAMLAQGDGKILIAEDNFSAGSSRLVRLLPNGRLDASFGEGGIVSFSADVLALALQRDRKTLAGGGSTTEQWALAQLLGGDNCVVPGLLGRAVSKAATALKNAYCRRGHETKRFSEKVARGRVISTAPQPGTRLPGGSKVGLVVSKGER